MSVPTIAEVTAQLQTQGAARAIHEDDVIAIMTALMAVGALWKTRGSAVYQLEVPDDWTLIQCWTDAKPESGGRGLLPNLSTHRATLETGAAGHWAFDWSLYLAADNDVEFGLRLNGGGVGLIGGMDAGKTTISVQCPAPVELGATDYLELVGRCPNSSQTANIGVYTGHLWARREIPSS